MRWAAQALLIVGILTAPAHAAVNLYSLEREIALGRQLADELERQVRLVDDPILSEYVNRVAQNIARQSEVRMPIIVRIIEAGDLNAFTLPGGHIYVNSAMLKLTESEAELAFVLAHEIGHATARHATRQASRDQLITLGSIPATIFGGWTGAALRQLVRGGSELGLAKSSRNFESQADELGLQFLETAGYDATAASDVFERIALTERQQPDLFNRLHSSHPLTESRIQHAQKILSTIASKRDEWVVNTSEYETMRRRAVEVEDKRIAAERRQTGPSLDPDRTDTNH